MYCDTEAYAEQRLSLPRYAEYVRAEIEQPTEYLKSLLSGVRFDTLEAAESFINGGGYAEGDRARLADIEQTLLSIVIGGDE